jgi:hypothetical protein
MLDQLLAAEQRAAEQLAVADGESSRLIDGARAAAAADDDRAAVELEAELELMRGAAASERAAAVEAIKRAAAARAAEYDRADAEAIGRRLVALILVGSRDEGAR